MWGVDKDNTVWFKEKTNPDLRMQRKSKRFLILLSRTPLNFKVSVNISVLNTILLLILHSTLYIDHIWGSTRIFRLQVSKSCVNLQSKQWWMGFVH